VENLFLPELNEAAVAAIAIATQDAPQRFRAMIGQYHGAMTRVRPSDLAFPLRERGYEVEVSSYWSAPGEKTSVVQWANALRGNLQSSSHGINANKLSETSGRDCQGGVRAELRSPGGDQKKYDPTNALRLNPNIRPNKLPIIENLERLAPSLTGLRAAPSAWRFPFDN
jgi:hypothetical protein